MRDKPGDNGRVAVLSWDLFQTRFNSDRNILNQTILLDNKNYIVIGVMPPGFQYPIQCRLDRCPRPGDGRIPVLLFQLSRKATIRSTLAARRAGM